MSTNEPVHGSIDLGLDLDSGQAAAFLDALVSDADLLAQFKPPLTAAALAGYVNRADVSATHDAPIAELTREEIEDIIEAIRGFPVPFRVPFGTCSIISILGYVATAAGPGEE